MTVVTELAMEAAASLIEALRTLAIAAPCFALLAIFLKGREALAAARRAFSESRLNLKILVFDALLVAPLLALASTGMAAAFKAAGLILMPPETWSGLPPIVVVVVAVLAGDFIGYWRHRLEHTRLLWPSHAVHHSDTEMTWLALFRFHPLNRVSSVVLDFAFLLMLGLPPYALIANTAVRHWYGMFIHADIPWTYGKLGYVFVSPAMHRWHHAKDARAFNTNYATVFSIFDLAFGTYRVPGLCTTPLGIFDEIGAGLAKTLAHPFRPSLYRRQRRGSSGAGGGATSNFGGGTNGTRTIAARKRIQGEP